MIGSATSLRFRGFPCHDSRLSLLFLLHLFLLLLLWPASSMAATGGAFLPAATKPLQFTQITPQVPCFLDASSHLYKRVGPSVSPSVCPSVGPSVGPSVRHASSDITQMEHRVARSGLFAWL